MERVEWASGLLAGSVTGTVAPLWVIMHRSHIAGPVLQLAAYGPRVSMCGNRTRSMGNSGSHWCSLSGHKITAGATWSSALYSPARLIDRMMASTIFISAVSEHTLFHAARFSLSGSFFSFVPRRYAELCSRNRSVLIFYVIRLRAQLIRINLIVNANAVQDPEFMALCLQLCSVQFFFMLFWRDSDFRGKCRSEIRIQTMIRSNNPLNFRIFGHASTSNHVSDTTGKRAPKCLRRLLEKVQ